MNVTRSNIVRGVIWCIAGLTAVMLYGWQASKAVATPWQLRDQVRWGPHNFVINQLPLQKVIMDGKTPLIVTTSANWKGYVANWAVRGEQLYLVEFEAQSEEGPVSIGDVIEGARLPLRATWFTGKLHLRMGTADEETQRYPLIVELTFQEGRLTVISTSKNAADVYTWDGLPYEGPVRAPDSPERIAQEVEELIAEIEAERMRHQGPIRAPDPPPTETDQ